MKEKEDKNGEINERFFQIRYFSFKGNNKEFANFLNYNANNLSAVCRGLRKPPQKICETIINKMPEISASWLFYGIGENPYANTETYQIEKIKKQYEAEIKELNTENNKLRGQIELLQKMLEDAQKKLAELPSLSINTECSPSTI